MSLEQWSYVGSLIGAVAVVASLIFVGVQLRQQTAAVRASTSQAHAALYAEINSGIIDNADFARIWRLGLGGIEVLAPDDRVRFVAFASTVFRFFESSYVQHQRGQLDTEHWHIIEGQAMEYVQQPGIQGWWTLRRHWHSPRFRDWIEGLPKTERRDIYGQWPAKPPARKHKP